MDEKDGWWNEECIRVSGDTFGEGVVPQEALDLPSAIVFGDEEVGWWNEKCIRVSGEMICDGCGKPYWSHESVAKEAPTLVRSCDGRLLKI